MPKKMSFTTWLKYEVIKFRYRHANGHGWFLYIQNAGASLSLVYILKDAAIEYGYISEFPAKVFVYLAILFIIGEYFIGYVNEKWGILKAENAYATEKMNPYFEELMEKVKSIEKRLR